MDCGNVGLGTESAEGLNELRRQFRSYSSLCIPGMVLPMGDLVFRKTYFRINIYVNIADHLLHQD